MRNTMPDFAIVFSALRSGTTVLRLMLDAHSCISCPDEADYMFDFLSVTPDGRWQYDRAALARDRVFKMAEVSYPEGLDGLDALSGMVSQIHTSDQLPILILHRGLKTAMAAHPGVKVIHMVRDPRDVAQSSIGMGWAGNVFFGVDHWLQTEGEWAERDDRFAPGQVLPVSYEALIANPDAELARITAFLGFSYEPEMLNYAGGTTYSKPDIRLVEQWHHKLTPRDLGLVEAKVGGLMQSRGYQPSGHPPIVPTRWQQFRLMLQNRSVIWGTKFVRFGYVDPVLAGFSKRLHLPALGQRARARMDEKTIKYLK